MNRLMIETFIKWFLLDSGFTVYRLWHTESNYKSMLSKSPNRSCPLRSICTWKSESVGKHLKNDAVMKNNLTWRKFFLNCWFLLIRGCICVHASVFSLEKKLCLNLILPRMCIRRLIHLVNNKKGKGWILVMTNLVSNPFVFHTCIIAYWCFHVLCH